MANVKNFGLIGVGSDLQFSKGGARIKQATGTFTLRNAADNADASLTASAVTASTGNITATLGDIVASAGDLKATLGNLDLLSSSATITIGAGSPANTASLSLAADGVFQFDGTAAFRAPTGNDAQRPTGQVGMIRVNTQAGAGAGLLEFYNGTTWVTSANKAVVDNLITSLGPFVNSDGTYNASAFASVPGISSPTSDLTDVIVEYTTYANTAFVKVDGTNAMAANLDMGGNRIVDLADPISDQDAATKYYVDNAIEGLYWKKACNLLASANVSLTGLTPLVIDGYTLTSAENGYRILLIDQDGSPGDEENGIYEFNVVGGNYTLTRTSDANTPAELNGAAVFIMEGTQYEGTAWIQTNHYLVTSFAGQQWVQFAGGGAYTATDGVTITGTVITANVDNVTIRNDSGGDKLAVKSSATAGQTLISQGTGDAVWGALDLADGDAVTGILPIAHGGTGASSFGQDRVIFASTTSPVGSLTDSASFTYVDATQVLTVGSVIVDGLNNDVTTTTLYAQNVTSSGDLTLTAAAGQDIVIADNGTTGSVLDFASGDVTVTAGGGTRLYINAAGAVAFSDGSSPTADFGVAGQFLKSNGAGAAPTWADASQLDAAGANTQVQFNDNGLFGADAEFTYNKTTNALTVGDITLAGGSGSPSNVTISAVNTNSALTLESNGTGDLVLDPKNGNVRVTDLTSTRVVFVGTAGALVDNANFIFNSGTTVLSVGAVSLDGATANTIIVKSGATERLRINEFGAVSFSDDGTSPNNDYGVAGQFLKSNGYGAAPSWSDASALDAAGNNTEVQFNDGGVFGADAEFTYNKTTNTLTVGDLTFAGGTGSPSNVTISASNLNSDLTLSTTGNGDIILDAGGSVVIGSTGAGVIESGTGETLTVTGDTGLTLGVNSGSVTINLPAGSPFGVVTVSGPTAQEYADAVTNSDLVNKLYVDQAIASGASAGAVKAYQATVNLNANGSTNIGTAMPAGATVLRVKVSVTVAATGTTSLQVGKAGGSEYMVTTENDLQTTGLYLAECFVTEAGSVQLQATVANATSGTAIVIVEYQVAQ